MGVPGQGDLDLFVADVGDGENKTVFTLIKYICMKRIRNYIPVLCV